MKRLASLGLLIAVLWIMGCGDGMAVFPNNDGIPNNCEYTTGTYYQPNQFARFDNNQRRLLLVDWKTAETIYELDTNINAARTWVLEWSPNCQYLVTHQDGTGIVYDVINGHRLVSFDNMRGYNRSNPSAVFDQTSTYLTVEAGGTTYLHHLLTGETYRLTDHYFKVQYFDYDRGQIIGIADDEVAAYSLLNGTKIASFGDLNLSRYGQLVFSPDGTTLAFTSRIPWVYVINRDTLARSDVFVGIWGNEVGLALSPDNRYLVMGYAQVDVWDLQNLQPIADHQTPPTFTFAGPDRLIDHIHFLDGGTIEAITEDGSSLWNLTTGEQISG
jgi:WD40 repeat protein